MPAESASTQSQEMRGLASALRSLATEKANEVHLEYRASNYLRKALELGCFNGPRWIEFRTDAEQWYSGDLPFVMASDWMLRKGHSLGLNVDQSRGNGDIAYWTQFFADLIEDEAQAIEDRHTTEPKTAADTSRDWWHAVNQWWKNNRISAVIVLLVVIIFAIVAFLADLTALWENAD